VSADDEFAVFYRSEFGRLAGALCLMVGDRGRAEDLAQEAMLRAYRSWSRVGEMDRPAAWLHQVGVNLVFRRRRRLRGFAERPHQVDEFGLVGVRAELIAALARLPVDQRTAVVVRHVLGYSTEEAAVVMDRSVGAVRAVLHRGVAALRAELQEETT
jgi:RNA polymerase sigma-70 factor (ECF subfamily)